MPRNPKFVRPDERNRIMTSHVQKGMKTYSVLVVLLLVLAACSPDDEPVSSPEVEGPTWQLVDGAVEGDDIDPPASHPITIRFEDGQVGGTASCNSYGGEYQIDGNVVTLGQLANTEMGCAPPETMSAESLFLRGLGKVRLVEIEDSILSLTGDGVEMSFEALDPVPDAGLTSTVWVLDGLLDGDAVSSVAGERATLEFFSDGSLIAGTGCRTLVGGYVVDGGELTVTNLSADGECPEELHSQDSRVVTAFEGKMRVEIEGDRLTTWVAGDEGLVYRAEG